MDRAALRDVRSLHERIDRAVAEVTARLPFRLACARGCSGCCLDDLTVFPIEAARIRDEAADLLATGRPAPPGGCAFLDADGACRIYSCRPYVCRTQGLVLAWPDDADRERRDLCPLSAEDLHAAGLELADVPGDACWRLGPWEERLAALQARHGGFSMPLPRVALRSLFGKPRGHGTPDA